MSANRRNFVKIVDEITTKTLIGNQCFLYVRYRVLGYIPSGIGSLRPELLAGSAAAWGLSWLFVCLGFRVYRRVSFI